MGRGIDREGEFLQSPKSSARNECDTSSIFERSSTGFNSKFSSS